MLCPVIQCLWLIGLLRVITVTIMAILYCSRLYFHICSPEFFYKQECFILLLIYLLVQFHASGLDDSVLTLCRSSYSYLALAGSAAFGHVHFFSKHFLIPWLHKHLKLIAWSLPFKAWHQPRLLDNLCWSFFNTITDFCHRLLNETLTTDSGTQPQSTPLRAAPAQPSSSQST